MRRSLLVLLPLTLTSACPSRLPAPCDTPTADDGPELDLWTTATGPFGDDVPLAGRALPMGSAGLVRLELRSGGSAQPLSLATGSQGSWSGSASYGWLTALHGQPEPEMEVEVELGLYAVDGLCRESELLEHLTVRLTQPPEGDDDDSADMGDDDDSADMGDDDSAE